MIKAPILKRIGASCVVTPSSHELLFHYSLLTKINYSNVTGIAIVILPTHGAEIEILHVVELAPGGVELSVIPNANIVVPHPGNRPAP